MIRPSNQSETLDEVLQPFEDGVFIGADLILSRRELLCFLQELLIFHRIKFLYDVSDGKFLLAEGDEETYKYFYLLTSDNFYQADLHQGNTTVRMDRLVDMASMILIHEILYGESADSLETKKRYKKEADEEAAGQLDKVYYDGIGAEKYWLWNDIILKTPFLDWETKKIA